MGRKDTRVTIRLSDSQIEILNELSSRMRVSDRSELIRFCINFTGAMLSMHGWTKPMIIALADVVREFMSDTVSDTRIKRRKGYDKVVRGNAPIRERGCGQT